MQSLKKLVHKHIQRQIKNVRAVFTLLQMSKL